MIFSPPIITIDGPSGAGKGTLSRRLANILGWNLLDSGIIYRILASIVLNNNIDINNEEKIIKLISNIKISFINKINTLYVLYNDKEIEKSIYTETIGNFASQIAILPKVRANLLVYQRSFCILPGLIADGRDMGTLVFPNAILKIFLYASTVIREQRRLNQLKIMCLDNCSNLFLLNLRERDNRDYNRKLAPLVPAPDALILDSTFLSSIEVENKVLTYIRKKLVLFI